MSAQFVSAKAEWKDWNLHSTSCQKHLPNPAPGRSKSGGFGDCGEKTAVTFAYHYNIKEGKNYRDSSGIPTSFMLEYFASSKSMRSSTPPAVQAGSTRGLREVGGPRLLGCSPLLIGLTACHSNWLPLQLTIHIVRFHLGVFQVANNKRYFFWGGEGGGEASTGRAAISSLKTVDFGAVERRLLSAFFLLTVKISCRELQQCPKER